MTGRYWDAIYDGRVLQEMSNLPLWAIEHRRPIRAMRAALLKEKGFLASENLFAPLSPDGENITILVAFSILN